MAAKNLLKDGQIQAALDQYNVIAGADPEDVQAYIHISEIYRRQGRYDDALEILKKANVVAATALEVPYNMAVIYQIQGRWELAVQLVQDLLLMTDKPDGNYTQADKNNRAIFLEQQGIIYRENNKQQLAIQALRKMLPLGDDNARTGYQDIINTYRDAKQWNEATAVAQEAVQKMPNDRELRMVLDAQLSDTGDPEKPVADVRSMLKGAPEDREVYVRLAIMYTRLRRWPDSEESLKKAENLSTKPEDKEYIYFLRGSTYEREKKYNAAETEFKKVLAANPESAVTLNYMGYMNADRGVELEESLNQIKMAVSLDPANSQYLDSLGWIYFKLGQYHQAETNLLKASEGLKGDPYVQAHLGRLYEKTGRIKLAADCWDNAIEAWKKTIAAEVDNEELAKAQSELRSAKLTSAHSPEQTGKELPLPPKSATDGPDLGATMQFIQDKLNSVGRISFAAYVHDNATGSDWTNQIKAAPTKVLADPTECRVDYHWRWENNGSVTGDFDDWFYLKNVEDIVVLPLDQQQNEWNAAAGHPSWNARVEPAVFVLKVRRTDLNKTNLFHFFDEQLANRVAKAMVHAVELCGGGSKPEPF